MQPIKLGELRPHALQERYVLTGPAMSTLIIDSSSTRATTTMPRGSTQTFTLTGQTFSRFSSLHNLKPPLAQSAWAILSRPACPSVVTSFVCIASSGIYTLPMIPIMLPSGEPAGKSVRFAMTPSMSPRRVR